VRREAAAYLGVCRWLGLSGWAGGSRGPLLTWRGAVGIHAWHGSSRIHSWAVHAGYRYCLLLTAMVVGPATAR
jgi:hypothetical protein